MKYASQPKPATWFAISDTGRAFVAAATERECIECAELLSTLYGRYTVEAELAASSDECATDEERAYVAEMAIT